MQRSFRSRFYGLAIACAALVAGIAPCASFAQASLSVSTISLKSDSADAMLAWERIAAEHARALMPIARGTSATWNFYGVSGAETAFRRNFAAMLLQQVRHELGRSGTLRESPQMYTYQLTARLDYVQSMNAMRITSEARANDRVVAIHTSIHSVKDDVGAIIPNGGKVLAPEPK